MRRVVSNSSKASALSPTAFFLSRSKDSERHAIWIEKLPAAGGGAFHVANALIPHSEIQARTVTQGTRRRWLPRDNKSMVPGTR